MAIGWLFHLDANSYLVVGVPLVVVFQLFVRKQPLAKLSGSGTRRAFGWMFWELFLRLCPHGFAGGQIDSNLRIGDLAVPHYR